jgi:hypothetical protein
VFGWRNRYKEWKLTLLRCQGLGFLIHQLGLIEIYAGFFSSEKNLKCLVAACAAAGDLLLIGDRLRLHRKGSLARDTDLEAVAC